MDTQNNNLLYGTINLQDTNHFSQFVDNLDYPQSIFILTQSIEYAISQGIYNMKEIELLSKSLRIIFSKNEEKNFSDK